ncbi:hypothetical protein J6590_098490 [Homalodisca vitripennis]|nr:hypothetical protein J6590_098490 [Homalodisca vitripennis]
MLFIPRRLAALFLIILGDYLNSLTAPSAPEFDKVQQLLQEHCEEQWKDSLETLKAVDHSHSYSCTAPLLVYKVWLISIKIKLKPLRTQQNRNFRRILALKTQSTFHREASDDEDVADFHLLFMVKLLPPSPDCRPSENFGSAALQRFPEWALHWFTAIMNFCFCFGTVYNEFKKKVKGDDTPVTPRGVKDVSSQKRSGSEGDSDSSTLSSGVTKKTVCFSCKKGYSYNAHRAICVKCQNSFHFKCIGLNKDDYNKSGSWLCDVCLPVGAGVLSGTSQISSVNVVDKITTDTANAVVLDILKEMREFRLEIKKTNQEFSNQLEKYSADREIKS